MIGISKLYCGTVEPSDAIRYERRSGDLPSHLLQFSLDKKPVVVWNVTQACNLNCVHCYAQAVDRVIEKEMTYKQGLDLIDDLSAFGVPVILFSGGEPLMRPDLLDLARYAVEKGIRAVISTNADYQQNGHSVDGNRSVLCRCQSGWHGGCQRPFPGKERGI